MAINFPNSPVQGTTYEYLGIQYTYVDTGGGTGFWKTTTAASSGPATSNEIDAGTDTAKYATPAGLEGSKYNAALAAAGTSYSDTELGLGETNVQGALDKGLAWARTGRKNLLINGGFNIWQRGSGPFLSGEYTADRFSIDANNTASKVTTGIAAKATYGLNISNDGNAPTVVQPVELPATGSAGQFLIGQTFTLSATITANAVGTLDANLVFRDISNKSLNQALAATQIQKVVDTTTQRITWTFVITGTPNPTNILLDVGIFNSDSSVTNFTVSQVQLEEGSIATPFEYRPIAEELALCQRYYEVLNLKGFTLDVDTLSSPQLQNSYGWCRTYTFNTTKRQQPTLSMNYSITGMVPPPSVLTEGSEGFSIGKGSSYGVDTETGNNLFIYGITVTADAEL